MRECAYLCRIGVDGTSFLIAGNSIRKNDNNMKNGVSQTCHASSALKELVSIVTTNTANIPPNVLI